jgi:two-component system, NtrC family, sensor kinase
MRMRWLRTALSLRVKITATFTLIVVGGTVVSTLIGSRIITNALLDQARMRAHQGLEAVGAVYQDQQAEVLNAVARVSTSTAFQQALHSGSADALSHALAQGRDAAGLSFLSYVDARGRHVVRAETPLPTVLPPALAGPVDIALRGQTVSSTEVLDHETLRAESPALAESAFVPIDAHPAATGQRPPGLTAGLVLFSAVPVASRGRTDGALYGGILRNNRHEIVDRAELLLYGNERHEDLQIGTVAILLDDVWISTNMMRLDGQRATGTVLPGEIARAVLGQGERWSGMATVDGEAYEAACQPIHDHAGRVVGALYVAILEAPILAARTEVMLTFLVVCLVGLVIVFALTYGLTRTMIRPLEQMVAATKRIAAGDLDVSVNVRSRDEIGELAGSFDNMLASLKRMNSELQEWAHTLEQKVRERTDELVSVQAQMARSEKLASIGRLAAGVAHGINNPLGGILSLTMLALEDMPEDHPLRDDLDTIVTQTLRCREIVKGLLDFSRQSDSRATRTDINRIVDSTLALLGRQASFNNIHIVRRLQEQLPPVLIDPGQLQEVVVNLVMNAADAMDENGVLTAETTTDEASGEVLIRVSDTGKGIPADIMPLLFEPFFTTKKPGRGTGLGLAIAHGVVTGAGGRIEVGSQPGATTFTVRLPAVKGADDHGAAAAAGVGVGQSAGG